MIGKIIILGICLTILFLSVGFLWNNQVKVSHNTINKSIVVGYLDQDDSGLFTTQTNHLCVVKIINDTLHWNGDPMNQTYTKIPAGYWGSLTCPYQIGDHILIQPQSKDFALIKGEWNSTK